jgi:hypothetical protein
MHGDRDKGRAFQVGGGAGLLIATRDGVAPDANVCP